MKYVFYRNRNGKEMKNTLYEQNYHNRQQPHKWTSLYTHNLCKNQWQLLYTDLSKKKNNNLFMYLATPIRVVTIVGVAKTLFSKQSQLNLLLTWNQLNQATHRGYLPWFVSRIWCCHSTFPVKWTLFICVTWQNWWTVTLVFQQKPYVARI